MKQLFYYVISVASCMLIFRQSAIAQKKPQEKIDSLLERLKTSTPDTNQVWLYIRIAQNYLSIHPATGVGYAYKGLDVAEKIGWKKGVAASENALGLCIGDSGNDDASRVHYLKAYEINKEINNSKGIFSNLANIGRSYRRQSDYTHAIEYNLKALKLAQDENNHAQIATVCTGLSAAYIMQQDYEKAWTYSEMIVHSGELSHTPVNTGKGYLNMAVIKMETKDTPTAKKYFAQSLKIYEEMGDSANILAVLEDAAVAEYPNYRKALVLMLEAQRMIDGSMAKATIAIDNTGNIGRTYYLLAMQQPKAARKKLLDSAQRWLDRAVALSKDRKDQASLSEIAVYVAELGEEKGDFKTAATNYRTHIDINDSIYSQDKKNQLAGLQSKYKLDLKDKEIDISKLELANQRRTQIALIAGLALLGIIGLLLYRQSLLRKKSNTTLMVLNSQLDEANKIKSKFFGILSHDLRSPIANLVNFLHLMKNEPQMLSAEDRASSQQHLSNSAEQLLETMETMLLWSKEQMEDFKPEIRILPVNDLFEYLQKFFGESGPIQLSFSNPDNLQVSGDENYLKVIMQNLTSNAIKALKQDPSGKIEWKAKKVGVKTILSIADNGPGLNTEQTRSLYQDGSSINAKTGFGFHLIRDLAKAIQYRISIESNPGVGTVFTLSA